MSERERFDIYISYASEDSAFVRELVPALRDQGLRIWYDEGEIRIGERFLRTIEDGLEHSRYFLLILSRAYFKRPWALFETGVALARGGKQHVLPVYLGVEPGELTKYSPVLANTVGISAAEHSPDEIAAMVRKAVQAGK
jgi:hypothetical protein